MPELQDAELLRTVLDSLQAGVCLMDRERKILLWNDGAERVTGYHRHEVVGHSCGDNVLPHCNLQSCDFCGTSCPLGRAVQEGKSVEARIELRHKEGHRVPAHTWVVLIRDKHNSIIGIAQSFERQVHVSEERRQRNLAMYGCLDEITGVPHHSFTEFHLRENLASFNEYHLPFGIVLIEVEELEHFQSVYGREAADAILRVIAQTIRNGLRPSDFLGRWANGQFLAILMNSSGIGIGAAAERIARLVSNTGLQWWGDELTVKTLLGYAAVQSGDTFESLLAHAQQSLEQRCNKRKAAAAAADGSAGR